MDRDYEVRKCSKESRELLARAAIVSQQLFTDARPLNDAYFPPVISSIKGPEVSDIGKLPPAQVSRLATLWQRTGTATRAPQVVEGMRCIPLDQIAAIDDHSSNIARHLPSTAKREEVLDLLGQARHWLVRFCRVFGIEVEKHLKPNGSNNTECKG